MRRLSEGTPRRRLVRLARRARVARRAAAALAAALLGAPVGAGAQSSGAGVALVVRDLGPGDAGRVLRGVLAAPHRALVPEVPVVHLPRDSAIATTVVVVGADVTVAARVDGDVVVIGGDLFVRPGARVRGRAIAFGGGVYDSRLASVQGGLVAFRDVTFVPSRADGTVTLAFQRLDVAPTPPIALPGVYGVRFPTYSRVDGLALPVAPLVTLAGGRLELEPMLTYRSHLGALDPGLTTRVRLGERTELELVAERGTFTNDAWARHPLVNAAATLAYGDDERNYYRAVRVAGRLVRRWEGAAGSFEPWVGARSEDASSLGPAPGATRAPWSLYGRDDTARMLRPNPAVLDGRLTSALAGARARWVAEGLTLQGAAVVELPARTPDDRRFTQLTVDAQGEVRTFADHRLLLAGHAVLTVGDTAPPQRFAYLGGGSTIPTLDELSLGGDQLLFLEGTYLVPLAGLRLPLVGAPAVGPRYVVGSAGVSRLPEFRQNVGLSLLLSAVRFDVLVDPATGTTSIGFSSGFP